MRCFHLVEEKEMHGRYSIVLTREAVKTEHYQRHPIYISP
jgi:hypothetical protein